MLFFQNSKCLRCGSRLGYDPERRTLAALATADSDPNQPARFADDSPGRFRLCANLVAARCNWLIDAEDDAQLCASCRLTTVRPNDNEADAMEAFAEAEGAKRRLLHQLAVLGLPVVARTDDVQNGVAFEFLSSRNRQVMTGHESGVITLDLSESDDAHREFVRQQLGEPYRTVLGHLRHEIGHYFWPHLVEEAGHIDEYRAVFGDERASYDEALQNHYGDSSGADDESWVSEYVSRYATMHPWEDWAETFAHYLHIRGGLETAESFGIDLGDPVLTAAKDAYKVDREITMGATIQSWLALTLALNGMSRSIGQGDLYPFVLSQTVIEKLDFVHRMVSDAAD